MMGTGECCCPVEKCETVPEFTFTALDSGLPVDFHYVEISELDQSAFPNFVLPSVQGPNANRGDSLSNPGKTRIVHFTGTDVNGDFIFQRPAIAKIAALDDVDMTLVLDKDGVVKDCTGVGGILSPCKKHHKPLTLIISSPSTIGTVNFNFVQTGFDACDGYSGFWRGDSDVCLTGIGLDTYGSPTTYRFDAAPSFSLTRSGVNSDPSCSFLNGTFAIDNRNFCSPAFGIVFRDGWYTGDCLDHVPVALPLTPLIRFFWNALRTDDEINSICNPDVLSGSSFGGGAISPVTLLTFDSGSFCTGYFIIKGTVDKQNFFDKVWTDIEFDSLNLTGFGCCDISNQSITFFEDGVPSVIV